MKEDDAKSRSFQLTWRGLDNFTLFLQGEAGEAGNPGPHGEPGIAVSALTPVLADPPCSSK